MLKVKITFNDKTSISPSQPTRSKIANFIRGAVERKVIFEGTACVDYGKGYKNEFDFTSKKELEDKLWPCLEKELVNEFR